MKFGGTSLSDEKVRRSAYRHILEEVKHAKVLVVVSAMGRYPDPYATDTLLSMGSPLLTKEEKARLVSMGEQLSALIVASELLDIGISAYALPFHKNGILSDHRTCSLYPHAACSRRSLSIRWWSPAVSSHRLPAAM